MFLCGNLRRSPFMKFVSSQKSFNGLFNIGSNRHIHSLSRHRQKLIYRSFSSIPSNGSTNTAPLIDPNSTINSKPVVNSKKKSRLALYGDLTKFRLSSLVVVTSGAGFLCGGMPLDFTTMAAACVGTGLCAASAGSFNQIIEKERDASMKRTNQRPLPSGRLSVGEASVVGVTTGLSGVGLLYAATNPVVAALGATNIFLYSVLYTYSKQYSEWNTWIGAVVGAIPPVMGYAAATGDASE